MGRAGLRGVQNAREECEPGDEGENGVGERLRSLGNVVEGGLEAEAHRLMTDYYLYSRSYVVSRKPSREILHDR